MPHDNWTPRHPLSVEGSFPERVSRVFRFDEDVYEEVRGDREAIPQAFAVVLGVSLLAGLGQGGLAVIFLGIAASGGLWLVASALIWALGVFAASGDVDYSELLRCTGFAYAWLVPMIGAGLPWIGPLFAWGALLATLWALVQATHRVFGLGRGGAAAICAAGFGLPVLGLFALLG